MITALLIIFALIIEYIYDPISNMKDTIIIDMTFDKYKSFTKGYIETKHYLYISFPIIIMLFFSILTYLLDNYLHSFFSFIISLIILVYCLKPNEFFQKIDDLKFAINSNEEIEEINRFMYIMGASELKKNSLDSLAEDTVKNIFYNSVRNIFSVMFCFLILGPFGSLAYIILDYFIYSGHIRIDQKSKKNIKLIVALIDYIPIRLCAFSFAVVADFEQCMKTWKNIKKGKDIYDSNINFINTIGESSIVLSNKDKEDLLLNKIIFIQSIISRAILAWLSLISLLIIGGFFI
tara:strand:- start:293 stop:1168 length:876 start_codon:yes stop_codon:yes gene_type:complete